MDVRFIGDFLDSKKQKRVVTVPRRHGKSLLRERVMEYQSAELARRIDFEVLSSALVSCGWTIIHIDNVDAKMLVDWAEKNCSDDYRYYAGVWVFKDPQDATLFQLRWA